MVVWLCGGAVLVWCDGVVVWCWCCNGVVLDVLGVVTVITQLLTGASA